MEMPFTKELLEIGWKWLNENASDKVGLCSDHSCVRCRLANVLFELDSRTNGNAQQQVQADSAKPHSLT